MYILIYFNTIFIHTSCTSFLSSHLFFYYKLLLCISLYINYRGVYLASLIHSDEGRILVTVDDLLPTIEISDSHPKSIGTDFSWLTKVCKNVTHSVCIIIIIIIMTGVFNIKFPSKCFTMV